MAEVAAVKEEKQEMKPEKKAAASPCRRKHGFYAKFKDRGVGREWQLKKTAGSPTMFLKPFIKSGDSIKNKVFQSLYYRVLARAF